MEEKETFTFEGKTYKVFTVDLHGRQWKLILKQEKYLHGDGLAVEIYDLDDEEGDGNIHPEPFTSATVNLGFAPGPDLAFADTNNNPWLPKFLRENKLARPTGDLCPSGYCMYPLYKWHTDRFTV